MRLIRFAPFAAAFALAPLATAQWSDNFEAYAAGSAIEGQGGWHQWESVTNGNQPYNRVVGTTGSITPQQGTKMLRVVGSASGAGTPQQYLSDTVHELNGPYTLGSGGWTFSTQTYVPTAFFGSSYVILMDDYSNAPGGPYDWAVQLHFDSASALVNMDAWVHPLVTPTGGPQTIVFDQWVELKLEIDLTNNTGRALYNGVEMQTFDWTAITAFPEVLDALDLYPGDENVTEIYYDSFSLAPGISGLPIGNNYCNSVANSTGSIGRIDAYGSPLIAANDVTLTASRLPSNAFMYFITSTTTAQINGPGGSLGNLCVTGSIGRYTGPGQIQNTGATGSGSLVLNLSQIPHPSLGLISAVPGPRHFQCWHRDSVGGQPVSNFTDATTVTFQ